MALSGSLWLAVRLSLALSDSLWLSIALQICLPSPCSAHKALARLGTPFLSSHTLISPVMDTTIISGLINFTMVASFTRFNSYDWFTSFAWSIRKWSINKKLGSLENFTWSILKCGR